MICRFVYYERNSLIANRLFSQCIHSLSLMIGLFSRCTNIFFVYHLTVLSVYPNFIVDDWNEVCSMMPTSFSSLAKRKEIWNDSERPLSARDAVASNLGRSLKLPGQVWVSNKIQASTQSSHETFRRSGSDCCRMNGCGSTTGRALLFSRFTVERRDKVWKWEIDSINMLYSEPSDIKYCFGEFNICFLNVWSTLDGFRAKLDGRFNSIHLLHGTIN